jgi:hypothetical protein
MLNQNLEIQVRLTKVSVLSSISDVFSNTIVTQFPKLDSGISCTVDVTFGSWQSFLAIAICTL